MAIRAYGRQAGIAACVVIASMSAAGCDAFNKGFNQAFDKSTHDSCVTSAVAHQASPDVAERYCSCLVEQLHPLSVQEKQHLSQTSDKVVQAVAHCKAQLQ